MRCSIVPSLGGCIAGLWLNGLPVLRATPLAALSTARQSGSYPLVPFSNRIGHASLQWQGTSHPLLRNNGDEPHAIHGVGWQRPWAVLEQSATHAMLSFEHAPDAAWPFAFDASQVFQLGPGTLSLTLGITNQSSQPAPVGLGWHPYFVKRPGSRLRFVATGRWDMGADKLPTQHHPATGLDVDCATLDVDHCFDGWQGQVLLQDEVLRTRVSANLTRLVVYTHPTRDFVAIEPVSHVNNALNLMAQWPPGRLGAPGVQADAHAVADLLGVQVLAPGESLSAQMTIATEPATP